MTNDELKAAAFAEAAKLNEHATAEEKARLDVATLDPTRYQHCVYGQLTGDCFNARANDLKDLCVPLIQFCVYGTPIETYIREPGADIAGIVRTVKGE